MVAAILTIGNELVSGDIPNTNGSWIAKRLEPLGVAVTLIASIPDEIDRIAAFVRREAPLVDVLFVTGGLGGTPDDITREALAAAFGVAQREQPEVAADLRARFTRDPDYVTRWAQLPDGSRALANPLGGAPGFAIANVYVLPGLPSEMEAMFDSIAGELGGAPRSPPGGAPTRRPRAGSRTCSSRQSSGFPACSSARIRASMRTGARWRSC